MISVQAADFSIAEEYQALREQNPKHTGAIATFSGLVRDFGDQSDVTAIYLEHYPGMTERQLQTIIDTAKTRWDIQETRIIHRIGKLELSEQIVFVGVSSAHRADAFQACQFIMDFLKADAPFWKKELTNDGESWVQAKDSDVSKAKSWQP